MTEAWIPIILPSTEHHNSFQVKKAILDQLHCPFDVASPFGYGAFDGETEPHKIAVYRIERVRLDSIMNNDRIMALISLTNPHRFPKSRIVIDDHFHYYLSPTYEFDEETGKLHIERFDLFYSADIIEYFKG